MTFEFAPNHAAISDRLRWRIENWQNLIPSTQFQQYGPINMLLTTIFPNDKFIIKPQALYRPMYRGNFDPNDVQAVATGDFDPNMDVDGEGFNEIKKELDNHHISIDSGRNVVVRDADERKLYPDFAITIYGDAIQRKEPINPIGAARVSDDGDVTRVIMEIASVPRNSKPELRKKNVLSQLRMYMDGLGKDGERWDTIACGIAIIGTEYAQLYPRKRGSVQQWTKSATWRSIYDAEFMELLEKHSLVA